jgi:Raf kinase inhibitor-like YbhB/YbcL family protein
MGHNVSPQLAWHNAPPATKSLAFFMFDAEGRNGAGTTHWVAYGVPLERGKFDEGEIARAPAGYIGGKSSQGLDRYMGPCTPPGTSFHHYTFVAIATDLAPDALPSGLTREELLMKLAGHSLDAAGIVARFRHP